jgi:hypothetical protein
MRDPRHGPHEALRSRRKYPSLLPVLLSVLVVCFIAEPLYAATIDSNLTNRDRINGDPVSQKSAVDAKPTNTESQDSELTWFDIFVAKYTSEGTLAWVKRAGGSGLEDFGVGIAALPDGGALVTGAFSDTATFGSGEPNETSLTAVSETDMFVARYNPDGTLAWAKGASGTGQVIGLAVTALPDGTAFVTGQLSDGVTFGSGEPNETTLTAVGEGDMFIAKYNPDGTLAWGKRAGGTGQAMGAAVAALPDGTALVTGQLSDAVTFGRGEQNERVITSAGRGDLFIARYGIDGTVERAQQAGCTGEAAGVAVAALADGSALIAGEFEGTVTFAWGEPNETTLASVARYGDTFIGKYDPDGSLVWVRRQIGSGFSDFGLAIAALPDGTAFVTGHYEGTAILALGEPNETTLTSDDDGGIFVARYRPDGTLAWARRITGSDGVEDPGVAVLPDGGAMIMGAFGEKLTFGEREPHEILVTSPAGVGLFLARYELDGTLAWARNATTGGICIGFGNGFATLPDGSILLTGSFSDTVTFGPGTPNETSLCSRSDWDALSEAFSSLLAQLFHGLQGLLDRLCTWPQRN